MTDRVRTRREFLEAAGSGLTGMALSPGQVASPQARRPTPHRGVEIAIATIALDGFGDEYFVAFDLLPKLPIKHVEFNVFVPAHDHALWHRAVREG